MSRLTLERVPNLLSKVRADTFVRIEREDPVVRGDLGRVVLLRAVTGPLPNFDAGRPSGARSTTVSSVLPESTTMISSAQATDWSAASMWRASSRVMTVTVSFTRAV